MFEPHEIVDEISSLTIAWYLNFKCYKTIQNLFLFTGFFKKLLK